MSEKKLKICFIAATLGKGGAEKQAYYLLKSLVENGHAIRLIYFEPEDWWKAPIQDLGVDVTRIAANSKKHRLKEAYQLLKEEKFDIVQALHYHMNPYATVLALLLRSKSIGAFRGDGERELQVVNKYIRSASFCIGKAFVCNSRSTIEKLSGVRILKGKLHYLPNIVEIPKSVSTSQNLLPSKFIAVNSLVKLKRVDRILKFIATYKKHNPEVELKILGDGPMKQELMDMVKDLEIESNVTFKGQVDNVSIHYQEADVFILASESEGTPNVILEAMSYGKVVVSSRVGDAAHLLKEGEYGLLMDFDSEQSVENMCIKLVSEWVKLKDMGLKARVEIQEHHIYANLYTNIKSIYQGM